MAKLELIDTDTAAIYLTVQPATLRAWRMKGTGPPYRKVGQKVCYDIASLDRWLDQQVVEPRRVARR